MRQKTRLILNSLVSVAAQVVGVVVRFFLVPFAIGILGQHHYGLWVVVGQMFAYVRILEAGLISAVAREVALHLGRGEPEKVDRHVNTAGAYLGLVGLVIVILTGVVVCFYTEWFDVEPQYHWHARAMVLCAGLALAYGVLQNAYAAMLGGIQRYDIIAGATILDDLLRLGIILVLLPRVGVGWGLLVLGLAMGGGQVLGSTLRTLSALRLCPYVRWRPWRGDRSLLWGMLGFGINSIIFTMSLTVGSQLAQILIGAKMSTAQATDFSLAVILLTAGHTFVCAFGMSTRVVASRYDGARNEGMLRHLLLRSTRYCALVSLAGVVVLTFFAEVLLRLWVGGEYPGAAGLATLAQVATTLRILTIAYAPFWLVLPAFNVVNGMGRHKFPAVVALTVGLASMLVVAVLVCRAKVGIDAVAWGVVLPMVVPWAVVLPWYCCREAGQPLGRFLWEGWAVPALACVPAAIAAYLLNRYHVATTWWTLGWQLAGCGALVLACGWFVVLTRDDRAHMLGAAFALWRRGRGGRADTSRTPEGR
ncbi:MAG TPA: lipopolysaccharide biosynthesis protein [Phycisphaerae bacterium]|nr:lipopolysaccharide biosynthesis protein [Phycisphaerae bacterium]HNU46311.1 lipopolysaccharide biosynthesis protein [Phycisphaerae bacterium]